MFRAVINFHRPRPAVLALLAALPIAAGVSACGGSSSSNGNGLQSKSADAIVKAAYQAANGLKSVRIAGTMSKGGTNVGLNLKMVAGVGAQGTISQQGKSFQLVVDHKTLYINAGRAFWTAYTNAAIAKLMEGKWLRASTTGSYSSFASFGDIHSLFGSVLTQHGKLAKGAVKTIRGVKAIGIRDTTQGGTLYVALTGKPYPLEIVGAGSGTQGSLQFTDFNSSLTITAPKHSVDLKALTAQAAG